ncbi:peroxisomal membrane anchor protein conserved region-domain-containing protein [Aspergillus ambiguus]|uniref:peroxisomal membrane protein PEX14 n=1 Tax=Aspergillus ambiguus TaxID=176160 RepID=UPI003CCD71C9
MSDPKPNRSIPQWQQQHNQQQQQQQPPATASTSPTSDDTPRATLIEQASKFLQDDSIRDAPLDRKISFLESKGLHNDEIDGLLGVARNTEATSPTASTTEEKTEQKTDTAPAPTSTPPSPPSTTPTAAPAATAAPRDVPPIITYPEFLVNQPKPPPLVTLRSILYTLYGAAGLGASFYGASEYLVKPMLASLTSARHDLAATASANLQTLNEKLEQNVSTIPPQLTARQSAPDADDDDDDETESITSDPTELFHRDVATQTSQDLGQDAPSSALVNSADEATTPDPLTTVNTHQKRLEILTSNLREFADLEKSAGSLDDSMRSNLNDLQHYLDGLLYSKAGYGSVTGYGVYSTPGIDSSNSAATGITKGEEDAISGFRSEIRGVKGALLSARNFPSGRGGRVGSGLGLSR